MFRIKGYKCILRDFDARYEAHYDSRLDRLKAFTQFTGRIYQANKSSLYSLLVDYIGIEERGSSFIIVHHKLGNGRAYLLEIIAYGYILDLNNFIIITQEHTTYTSKMAQ